MVGVIWILDDDREAFGGVFVLAPPHEYAVQVLRAILLIFTAYPGNTKFLEEKSL